ncbi:hypothetical protein [Campylobacter sp. CCS1377]|uniref:Uncharacterized protein n=1 Tax=Campylobacter sp. CCS1377 TaxID=3158229 RepID=A0AAU7E6G6_9BACT
MAGEFLMIYENINANKIRKISTMSDEAIKASLANEFLDLVAGFNISRKQYKREFAEFLEEKGAKDDEILKLTKLSKKTLERMRKCK